MDRMRHSTNRPYQRVSFCFLLALILLDLFEVVSESRDVTRWARLGSGCKISQCKKVKIEYGKASKSIHINSCMLLLICRQIIVIFIPSISSIWGITRSVFIAYCYHQFEFNTPERHYRSLVVDMRIFYCSCTLQHPNTSVSEFVEKRVQNKPNEYKLTLADHSSFAALSRSFHKSHTCPCTHTTNQSQRQMSAGR